ncbi:hypothetical protein Tco_0880911 [Tanacetum coccineum]
MVASIAMWFMRPNKDNIDVYEAYATQESLFSLKVNYAGFFTESPGRSYVNGDFSFFDCIDINEFSVHELNDMVKKIGFSGKTIMYYSFLKLDMSLDNGLYALGNDEDVKRMSKYIRLGYKIIEVFIEHDKTTVFTYIDAAYNTPKKHEDGESSQPNTTNPTTQTDFDNDFYSASDTFLVEDDFDHFFGLDSEPVDATNAKNECVDKGKRVALDDDQIHVQGDNTMENETYDGNSDGDSSESSKHDELMDTNNKLVEVEVDIAHFDKTNAKKIGNEGKPKFNTDEEFDIGMDVIDPEEFESASDEDRIKRIRSRKLKHLKRQNKVKEGGVHKLVDVRDRPIINTLEYAREYLMKRIVLVKQVIDRSDGLLTPTDTRLFNVVKAKASECIANFNGGILYWVTRPWGEVCVVDVQNKIYSCRKWEIIGMSCKHAVASNWNMASNNMEMGFLESWVHLCYRLDTWKQVYSHHINPIRGKIM